jgi:DNA-binding transcriptional MerR regulator
MSTFDDFVMKWNGKPCEMEDPSAPDQCMDLAFAWCDTMNVDRETIRHQFAYQVWTLPNDLTVQKFEYIPNTPNGVPKEGDLVIFNINVGSAGHISIATGKGNADNFESFDQNWSGVQYCRLITHVYTSVYGWLRKKKPVAGDPTVIEQSNAFIAIATKLNTSANKDIVLAEIDKLVTIEDQAPAKDKQLSEAQSQITFLQEQISELKKNHDELEANIANQARTIQDQDKQIQALSGNIDELSVKLQEASKYTTMTGWELIAQGITRLFGRK